MLQVLHTPAPESVFEGGLGCGFVGFLGGNGLVVEGAGVAWVSIAVFAACFSVEVGVAGGTDS